MKKQNLMLPLFLLLFGFTSLFSQQQQQNDITLTLTYITTNDHHSGVQIGMEDYIDDHVFLAYHIGVSQSHYLKREYIVNWDFGYRFHISNRYQPDFRMGFGYLFGDYKKEMLTSKNENSAYDSFVTVSAKLGLLNWNLAPIRLITNVGIQGQFPLEYDAKWHTTLEVGLGYQFK